MDKRKAFSDIKKVVELFDEIKLAITLMEKDKLFKDLEDGIQYVIAKEQG